MLVNWFCSSQEREKLEKQLSALDMEGEMTTLKVVSRDFIML